MKNVWIALLITTGAVACADNRPAQEPTTTTSASSTTAATATNNTPATVSAPAADPSLSTRTDNAAMGTSATAGTTSSMTPSDGSKSAPILGDTHAMATNDSSAGATTKNTGKLTPMDQGGSKGDRDITAAIRRSVVADSSLSFTGKNVKIITKDGHVTLRGQVKSDAERSTIDGEARNAAGVVDVDNQLTVKP